MNKQRIMSLKRLCKKKKGKHSGRDRIKNVLLTIGTAKKKKHFFVDFIKKNREKKYCCEIHLKEIA